MGLSRLDNFLKSSRGTIIYVDPNSLDSTDSIENTGNSLTRPFKTIQRALIEAARFSYQRGQNNDRFNKTTILLYPGEYLVDNRPGYIVTGSGQYLRRGGENVTDLNQWDLDTNFDITNSDNTLYKLNSIYGGIIVPRGVSIVGYDLRKTKIRPLFVPNPENNNIERSCIFRVTGGCYFWQFTLLDADPNGICFKDYTSNVFVPNFSHHKLAGFEYADGVNSVVIQDAFVNYTSTRTDLDMYYEKIAAVYGATSGREIAPDYGSGIDIQPVVDEYRIVGSKGTTVGITSIQSSGTTVTVNLVDSISDLSVDSPIQINGVNAAGYDGQYVVSSITNNKQLSYKVQNAPLNTSPNTTGATLSLAVDTVTSASPYIFNISLRSVYGMCGLLADGDKATGFKSMVVAQYTGIGLQKDDNAFVKYDSGIGEYRDSTIVPNLHTDSRARFKPSYENFHIKAVNDSFLQLVSVFAIGYANHFVTESGGDIALNNSNSNFGAKSLVSSGFRRESFSQDDYGYITHIIPPKEIESSTFSIEFDSIDVGLTTSRSAGAATTDRLYLYNETNENVPPKVIVDGYHIGAKSNEQLSIQVYQSGITTTYSSQVVMPYGSFNSTQVSSEKTFTVGRSISGINSIGTDSADVLVLTQSHSLINGESIRIIAENGHLPDGLNSNQIYYTIANNNLGSNKIKIAKTLNDALNGNSISLNSKGGVLSIVSRVNDKNPGDIGHPVQWDTIGNWYIQVSTTSNQIYDAIKTFGTASLGNATSRSFVTRKSDSRNLNDTLYRVRYVLPKDSPITARPPTDGFILQESNNIIGSGTNEISQIYDFTAGVITNSTQLRNSKFIASASWSSNIATITTEVRHELKVGDQVEIVNVKSSSNTSGTKNLGFNGTYKIVSIPSSKEFTYSLTSSPGTFQNDTSARTETLPYVRRKKFRKTYQVYRSQEIQSYVPNIQDGIYYLTLIQHSNYPTVSPFAEESYSQPIANLYPQTNRDNPNSDPRASISHALPNPIGQVVINDLQNSITKETLETLVIGYGITDIRSTSSTEHTIFTSIDHGFSGITSVSIVSGGSAYGSGSAGILYNAKLVGFAGSTTGSNATAKITLNGGGSITAINIIDGGSAYGIGNTLTVVGVATTAGHVIGVVRVESIANNLQDTIQVSGVSSALNSGYNNLYRISGITTGRSKEISVVSSQSISPTSSSGIGSVVTSSSGYIPTGKALVISSFSYSTTTGLATIGFTTSHGYRVDNKIRVGGANQSFFNGDFVITRINSLTSLVADVGIGTTFTSATGTLYSYRPILASYGGDLINDTENSSGRLVYEYDGITTVLGTSIFTTSTDTTINIPNATTLGLKIGDYLLITNEIFRISSAVTSNNVSIFRAVLGSPRQSHTAGSVIRRIKVRPVELRRNSIIRASGHTFEYLGYGPGNYSTSLPEKQDRILSSTEKFLAQATKSDGGIVVYTGMNSDGDFFTGNKKINSATGKEETFDTPVPTFSGEKEINDVVNITETQKLFVTESIKVNGGKDKSTISEFDGPVVFNNKVTTKSNIEANSILIQGNEKISREINISNTKPSTVGNYGDIVFNSTPRNSTNTGWIYTVNNEWKSFGWISDTLYGVGISSNSGPVGFSTLIDFVGVGLTVRQSYNPTTGISTIYLSGDPKNTIGISSGGVAVGNANEINFVGDRTGFGVNLVANFNNTLGIATITFRSPVNTINFGNSVLGYGAPSFATTSPGTRIIYENRLNSVNTNYAIGIDNAQDTLWWSVPQNSGYRYKWYGGITEIARLETNGSFTIFGNSSVTASRFISTVTTGTSPISVASSTLVSNLNANYLDGLVSTSATTPNSIVRRDASNNINGNVSHLIHNVSGAQRGEWYTDIPARLGYIPFNRAGDSSSGICTFTQISDIYKNQSSASTVLTCDFSTGPITRTTSTDIQTINIANVPITDLRASNYTIVLNAASVVSSLSSIQFQVNGSNLSAGGNSIRWLNNIPPSGTNAGYYFFGFSIFRVGSVWEVLGVFASYA